MSTHLNNKVTILLDKFRLGKISSAEFQELKSNISSINDSELKETICSEWEKFCDFEPLPEEKIDKLYERLTIKTIKPHFTLKLYWMKIAASLLLIIAGGLTVFTYTQMKKVNALAERSVVICSGEYGKSLITLPDGTIVHLNAKSSLTYSQDFGKDDRNVKLSGEGFFEVEKDTEKQFTVTTKYMDITVLGTKFNVYAYENKEIVEMALVEGQVDITTINNPNKSINVKPNEKITYNKNSRELTHEHTDNKMETAWLSKELAFRSERLADVFSCLSRKFAVTFNVDDVELLDDIYTGTFEDNNIESIMQVLKIHYNLDYKNENGIITIRTKKMNINF